jgi:DNA-binding NarL/FixJ family response regulator
MERLLLVERNLLLRDCLALLLKWQTGLHSVLARSLAEAQYVLDDVGHKPLCVIVGLDLPDGDGSELVGKLDGIPVLALIGSRGPDPERRAAAMRLGADEVLRKSEPTDKIIAAVERLVFAEAERRHPVSFQDRVRPGHVG